ncbi:hypothetical protein F4680DRAFT_453097 [Xylaria scruposa]|nr:hypothetical protein F4680DRAFT_453097 [Xylaria scruposa]
MPSMAGTLGLHAYGLGAGLWEMPFAAPVAAFLEDWFALQYLLPLISFVCVGLEGWCFFDLTRKSLGARSARAIADARDAASLEDYDVIKDFPRGGFEPSVCSWATGDQATRETYRLSVKPCRRKTRCQRSDYAVWMFDHLQRALIANAKKAQERDVLDRNMIIGQTHSSTIIHHQSAKKITALHCRFDEKGFLQSKAG